MHGQPVIKIPVECSRVYATLWTNGPGSEHCRPHILRILRFELCAELFMCIRGSSYYTQFKFFFLLYESIFRFNTLALY